LEKRWGRGEEGKGRQESVRKRADCKWHDFNESDTIPGHEPVQGTQL